MSKSNPSQTKHADEMSFFEHLETLRWHLIRAIVAVIVVAIVVFVFKDWIFDHIIFAPRDKDFVTYRFFCGMGETMCFYPAEFRVQAFKLEELFTTAIKCSVVLGFVVAFPYIFYEIWSFIKPGLYEKEVKAARGMIFNCSLLFFIGVLFGYYVITPFAISFLTSFTIGDAVAEPTLGSYMNSMIMFTLPTGLIFELPIVIYLLAKAGIVGSKDLAKHRKIAFVIILIVSAIVTPPDMITQIMISLPLYTLYEVSIHIAKRVEKKQTKDVIPTA